MQLVSEMPLPTLPLEDPKFDRDPMPYINAAREQHKWLAQFSQGYFVFGYQAMKDLLIMDDKLRPSHDGVVAFYGAQGTDWGRYMEEMILAQSGPTHARIRQSVGDAFTPRNVRRHMDLIRQVISDLLDEWAPKGRFDFAEFASFFPVSVLCGLLGTSTRDIPGIRNALETQTAVFNLNKDLLPDLLAGYQVLWDYCDKIIVDREKSGEAGDGVLDALIGVKQKGLIDDTELRFLLMVLFPAGYDTSKNMLTLTMHTLLKHPDIWARCGQDRAFCDKVVDESFRHTSTATQFRTVFTEFDYDGIRFPKDTRLFFGNSLAGRDPDAFEDPMEFSPEKVRAQRHVAFGRGAHICLGQHLARTQIAEGLHAIAQRLRNPRLAGEIKWRPYLGVWGLRTLPIEFEPGEATPVQASNT